MEEFKDVLMAIRKASFYRSRASFGKALGCSEKAFFDYESGETIPNPETVEKIIYKAGISDGIARQLRAAANVGRAKKKGIQVEVMLPTAGLSDVTDKILHEIEHELKRAGIKIPAKTSQICGKRIAIILGSVLGLR